MNKDIEKIIESGTSAEILGACFQEEGIDGEFLEQALERLQESIKRGANLCFDSLNNGDQK